MGITKSYLFHNSKSSSSEESDIDDTKIDTEYNDIDPKTYKKIIDNNNFKSNKSDKSNKNDKSDKSEIIINKNMNGKDIDKLFKNYLFSS